VNTEEHGRGGAGQARAPVGGMSRDCGVSWIEMAYRGEGFQREMGVVGGMEERLRSDKRLGSGFSVEGGRPWFPFSR
jgi:hypothetical protein